ncbi:hypothetical protein D3C86_1630970 [compost metagenome]
MGEGIGIAARDFFKEHAEFLGGGGGFFKRAVQGFETRIESLDVLVEQLWRVAFRVQGDEDHLQPFAIATHQLLGLGGAGQGGRAHGRALGETEEHHRHQAAIAAQHPGFALRVLELEVTPHDLVAEVLAVVERQLAAVVATGEQAQAQQAHALQDSPAGIQSTHEKSILLNRLK